EKAVPLRAKARDRCDVDDRSAAAIAHAGGDGLHQTEGAFQIDLDHFVELHLVDFETWSERDICRGVVHQNVDGPKFACRDSDHIFDLVRAADVASDWLNGWPDFG